MPEKAVNIDLFGQTCLRLFWPVMPAVKDPPAYLIIFDLLRYPTRPPFA